MPVTCVMQTKLTSDPVHSSYDLQSMVIGNLWSVTDTAVDAITVCILHNWLPVIKEMVEDEPDLLCAFNRSHNSVNHYMATAALVARGLPVVTKAKVDKNTVAQHYNRKVFSAN